MFSWNALRINVNRLDYLTARKELMTSHIDNSHAGKIFNICRLTHFRQTASICTKCSTSTTFANKQPPPPWMHKQTVRVDCSNICLHTAHTSKSVRPCSKWLSIIANQILPMQTRVPHSHRLSRDSGLWCVSRRVYDWPTAIAFQQPNDVANEKRLIYVWWTQCSHLPHITCKREREKEIIHSWASNRMGFSQWLFFSWMEQLEEHHIVRTIFPLIADGGFFRFDWRAVHHICDAPTWCIFPNAVA